MNYPPTPVNPTDRQTCIHEGVRFIWIERYSSWFAMDTLYGLYAMQADPVNPK